MIQLPKIVTEGVNVMDKTPDLEKAMSELNNPDLSPEQLYQIAGQFPDLFPQVAAHPNTYPELLDWLRQSPDPTVTAVIALRAHGIYGKEAVTKARESVLLNTTVVAPESAEQSQTVLADSSSINNADNTDETSVFDSSPNLSPSLDSSNSFDGITVEPTVIVGQQPTVLAGQTDYVSDRRGAVLNDQTAYAAALDPQPYGADPYLASALNNNPAGPGNYYDPYQVSANNALPDEGNVMASSGTGMGVITGASVGATAGMSNMSSASAATAGGSAMVGSPNATAATSSQKKGSSLNALLGVILVVAMVALGIVLFLLLRGGSNTQADAPQQETTTTQEKNTDQAAPKPEGKDAPTPAPSEQSKNDVRPAPSSSIPQTGTFTTQYGNIVCEMNDQGVTCTILKQQTATCGGGAYTVRSTQSGVSQPECTTALGAGSQVIGYNQYYHNGTGVCFATEAAGMECYNTKTGHGFRLRQAELQTF